MLHKNIKQLIVDRGTKKKDLAVYLGISRSTLDAYLNGSWPVPSDVLEKMAGYFDVSVGSLFGETDQPDKLLLERVEKLEQKLESIANSLQIKKT